MIRNTTNTKKNSSLKTEYASLFTRNLLKGEKVYVVNSSEQNKTDRYGRTLAYIYRFPDGLFVNAEIVRQGYGLAYTQFPFKYMEEFKQLGQFARKAEKGQRTSN